jgi:hypothetical protein
LELINHSSANQSVESVAAKAAVEKMPVTKALVKNHENTLVLGKSKRTLEGSRAQTNQGFLTSERTAFLQFVCGRR